MTSEVVLMNRQAIALAADSATTVTYWHDGEKQVQYLKGANKIFNLSNKFPIGLMICDSDNLQGIPWEVLAKAYRDEVGHKTLRKLSQYPKSLFDFLTNNKNLFPQKYQEEHLILAVKDTAINIALNILLQDSIQNIDDEAQKRTKSIAKLNLIANESEKQAYLTPNSKNIPKKVRDQYFHDIQEKLKQEAIFSIIEEFLNVDNLINLACDAYFKKKWSSMSKTGLVFAGYGKDEYFPQLERYDCHGVVLGDVLREHNTDDRSSIHHTSVSDIVPVAQSDMAYTFMYGTSIDVLVKMDRCFDHSIDTIIDELKADGHVDVAFDQTAYKDRAKTGFNKRLKEFIWKEHSTPFRRAVGFLPVDDLAELAESIVSIESLKERVTRQSQSVSGPIDVAVITKGDGFIWIKRKHYFDPNLNLRYVSKKQKDVTERATRGRKTDEAPK